MNAGPPDQAEMHFTAAVRDLPPGGSPAVRDDHGELAAGLVPVQGTAPDG